MRKRLRKVVRELFSLQMEKQVPQFRATKGDLIPPEYDVYVWPVADELWFYLSLQTHQRRDAFTIEVGWTARGRFPQCLPSQPYDPPQDGEMRFRLIKFWRKDNIDVWWELDPSKSLEDVSSNEELLARLRDMDPTSVPPVEQSALEAEKQVDAAFQKLTKFALPYFDEIIRTRVHRS